MPTRLSMEMPARVALTHKRVIRHANRQLGLATWAAESGAAWNTFSKDRQPGVAIDAGDYPAEELEAARESFGRHVIVGSRQLGRWSIRSELRTTSPVWMR
jgi:hypothetical protein